MATRTLALVGAAGGVGTTRLTLETGTVLARAGHDVVIFDASFATQGLGSFVQRVDRGVTDLLIGEATLEETLYDLDVDLDGRLALCPAVASFECLARAKTTEAAERFRDQIATASLAHDVILVDVPPLATNQGLAAIETVRQVAIVTADTERGARALDSQIARLDGVGVNPDATVCNHADDGPVVADAVVSTADPCIEKATPWTAGSTDGPFTRAIVRLTELVFDISLDIDHEQRGSLRRFVGLG